MATIGTGGVSNGGMVNVSGSTLTVPLTNVANAQTIKIKLSGVTSGTTSQDLVIPMSILAGDTSGNGTVNATDVRQTKAQAGQPVTVSNFRADVNASGSITASDVALVKSATGTSVSAPARNSDAAR